MIKMDLNFRVNFTVRYLYSIFFKLILEAFQSFHWVDH